MLTSTGINKSARRLHCWCWLVDMLHKHNLFTSHVHKLHTYPVLYMQIICIVYMSSACLRMPSQFP